MNTNEQVLQEVVIKFAGDSGDGMQLTGQQFTNNTALLGIDLATFPDFPAEIRNFKRIFFIKKLDNRML